MNTHDGSGCARQRLFNALSLTRAHMHSVFTGAINNAGAHRAPRMQGARAGVEFYCNFLMLCKHKVLLKFKAVTRFYDDNIFISV
jgi:hypothetical protein